MSLRHFKSFERRLVHRLDTCCRRSVVVCIWNLRSTLLFLFDRACLLCCLLWSYGKFVTTNEALLEDLSLHISDISVNTATLYNT